MTSLPIEPVAGPDTDALSLIVFGLDEAGKPHASSFVAAETDQAVKAAGLMGMAALHVSTDEHRTEAAKLPRGRVFGSGKAFVPFVKAEMYARLKAFVREPDLVPGAVTVEGSASASKVVGHRDAGPSGGRGKASNAALPSSLHLPMSWGELKRGSVVLAPEDDGTSWWAAIVLSAEITERVSLKWRDFAGEAPFVREVRVLGLLNPASA